MRLRVNAAPSLALLDGCCYKPPDAEAFAIYSMRLFLWLRIAKDGWLSPRIDS